LGFPFKIGVESRLFLFCDHSNNLLCEYVGFEAENDGILSHILWQNNSSAGDTPVVACGVTL